MAQIRMEEDRLKEARVLLEEVLRRAPSYARALGLMGIVHHRAGRFADARGVLEKARVSAPSDVWVQLRMGLLLSDLGDKEGAISAYRSILSRQPNHPVTWYHLGKDLLDLERFEEAEQAYTKAVDLDPKHVDAWTGMGVCAKALDRFDDAREAFDRALALRPGDRMTMLNLAGLHVDEGRPEEALRVYDELLGGGFEHSAAHFNRALALSDLKRFPAAIAAYADAIRIDPKNVRAHLRRAGLLHEAGRYAEARDGLLEAAKIAPRSSTLFHDLGLTYWRLGEHGLAREALGRSIENDPANAGAHAVLGLVLGDEKDFEGAARSHAEAARLAPKDFSHRQNEAVSLVNFGRYEEAADVLARAATDFPEVPAAHAILAWTLVAGPKPELWEPAKAVPHARRATKADPDNPFFGLTLGLALYRAQRYAQARAALQEARQNGAPDAHNACFLAMTLKKLGLEDDARSEFGRAEKLSEAVAADDSELRRFFAEARALILGKDADDRSPPGRFFRVRVISAWRFAFCGASSDVGQCPDGVSGLGSCPSAGDLSELLVLTMQRVHPREGKVQTHDQHHRLGSTRRDWGRLARGLSPAGVRCRCRKAVEHDAHHLDGQWGLCGDRVVRLDRRPGCRQRGLHELRGRLRGHSRRGQFDRRGERGWIARQVRSL